MSFVIPVILSIIGLVLFICLLMFLIAFYRFSKRQGKSLDYVQLEVRIPKYNEIKLEAAEGFFTSLYSLFRYGVGGIVHGQEHIGFEIVSADRLIKVFISSPESLASLVEKQIHSYYPEAEIAEVPEYNFFRPDMYVDIAELSLRAKAYKPVLRFHQMK